MDAMATEAFMGHLLCTLTELFIPRGKPERLSLWGVLLPGGGGGDGLTQETLNLCPRGIQDTLQPYDALNALLHRSSLNSRSTLLECVPIGVYYHLTKTFSSPKLLTLSVSCLTPST